MPEHACKPCMHLTVLQRTAVLAVAAGLSACSSTPQPVEQVELARAAVSQAQPVAVADGAPELHVAQAKLARAELAVRSGDYVSARILAEQAEVDAKYAWTLAEHARMQRAAADINQRVKLLRDQLDRRGK